jgi:hypothetical protein
MVQAVMWETRFTAFNSWLSRRYGNVFTLNLPFSGHEVMVAEPEIIRSLFADRGERTHAGEANSILEPIMTAPSTPASASSFILPSTASGWPATAS